MERVDGEIHLQDVIFQFEPAYIREVCREALEFRDHASQGARDSLNAAINNSEIRLQGFRDTSKAGTDVLAEEVFHQMADGNEKVIRSALRTWAESRDGLREYVTERLDGLGLPTQGLKTKGSGGVEIWEAGDWLSRVEVIHSESGGVDEEDVRLMMTCVSGMSPELPPEPEVQSKTLNHLLDELKDLPAEADDWNDFDDFLRELASIGADKMVERRHRLFELFEEIVAKCQQDFDAELNYLEIDLSGWISDAQEHPAVFPQAPVVAEALHDGLMAYVKLWPKGRTRSEELERRQKREQCEDDIMAFVKEWDELVNAAKRMEEQAEEDEAEDESPSPEAVEDSVEDDVENSAAAPDAAMVAELEEVRQQNRKLSEEKAALEAKGQGLAVTVADLEGEVDRLRRELYESQQNEQLWREQFVSVSRSMAGEKGDEQAEISDVEDAVKRASRAFPNQLVVALNSKSDVETPFKRPEEVYSVLAWLGTEYHRARTREMGRGPQFDKLLKEACSGWFYKPKQTDETKDQFPDWYRTRVGDRMYELDAHVGKGTSFDPQNTIRIAFDWDEEDKRVVVGYIGRHQKNRRS